MGAKELAPIRAKMPEKGAMTFFKRLLGIYPRFGPVRPERKDGEEIQMDDDPRLLPHRSFLSFVPFQRYDPDSGQVVLVDGRRAAFFDLRPADIEGRPREQIDAIAGKIATVLANLPESDPPWLIQIYMHDEPIRSLIYDIVSYIEENAGETEYSHYWMGVLKEHFEIVSRREGVFTEERSELPWRARNRKVRIVLSRAAGGSTRTAESDLVAIEARFQEGLREASVRLTPMDGDAIRTWLLPWYSGMHESAWDFLRANPYPHEDEKAGQLPPDWDLGEICLNGHLVRSDSEENYYKFGERYNRFLTLQPYRSVPRSGFWNSSSTGEQGDSSPFDRMPDGSTLTYTLCVEPQDIIKGRLELTRKNAIGDNEDADHANADVGEALGWMSRGNRLVTWLGGIYVDATSLDELNHRTRRATAIATGSGYQVIEPENDLVRMDTFLRALPLNTSPKLDKKKTRRMRLGWESHLGRLMPFYGRGTGSGRPGIPFFNRTGEPFLIDPLGKDRQKNAHALILGPTGSGKTATIVHIMNHLMAVHRPRLYLITLLPTFYLLGQHLEKHGFKVHRVSVTEDNINASLCPFSNIAEIVNYTEKDAHDYVTEAVNAAIMMITGGDAKRADAIERHSQALIVDAVNIAAKAVAARGDNQGLTSDVVRGFIAISKNSEVYSEDQRRICTEFAATLRMFTVGNDGMIFDRPGEVWPDADVTIVELGYFGRPGYEDRLAIATTGLIQRINTMVEAKQFDKRHTIVCIDEAHKFIKHPNIGPYLNAMAAMWRTFGCWLWISTQNLKQFPEEAKELLDAPEWWFCLNTEKDEVNQISRFKQLTEEQKHLLQSAIKEMGKFTEGVVMSKNFLSLFRNVPPALSLALAQTEKDEKADRMEIARREGITELEAAYRIADRINARRMKCV